MRLILNQSGIIYTFDPPTAEQFFMQNIKFFTKYLNI